jgi:hypothetical protein
MLAIGIQATDVLLQKASDDGGALQCASRSIITNKNVSSDQKG